MTANKSALEKLNNRLGAFSFGEYLLVARASLGLTQVEMVKKLKIARGTLCDIEKGRKLVTPSLAKKFAKAAGLSVELAIQACLQDQLTEARVKFKVNLMA